jgi:hypothetical protein
MALQRWRQRRISTRYRQQETAANKEQTLPGREQIAGQGHFVSSSASREKTSFAARRFRANDPTRLFRPYQIPAYRIAAIMGYGGYDLEAKVSSLPGTDLFVQHPVETQDNFDAREIAERCGGTRRDLAHSAGRPYRSGPSPCG